MNTFLFVLVTALVVLFSNVLMMTRATDNDTIEMVRNVNIMKTVGALILFGYVALIIILRVNGVQL